MAAALERGKNQDVAEVIAMKAEVTREARGAQHKAQTMAAADAAVGRLRQAVDQAETANSKWLWKLQKGGMKAIVEYLVTELWDLDTQTSELS